MAMLRNIWRRPARLRRPSRVVALLGVPWRYEKPDTTKPLTLKVVVWRVRIIQASEKNGPSPRIDEDSPRSTRLYKRAWLLVNHPRQSDPYWLRNPPGYQAVYAAVGEETGSIADNYGNEGDRTGEIRDGNTDFGDGDDQKEKVGPSGGGSRDGAVGDLALFEASVGACADDEIYLTADLGDLPREIGQ